MASPSTAIKNVLRLPTPEDVAAYRVEELAALLAELAASVAAVGARLAVVAAPHRPHRLMDIKETARRMETTVDWLDRNGKDLPFFVRVSDGQVRWSERGFETWCAKGGRR